MFGQSHCRGKEKPDGPAPSSTGQAPQIAEDWRRSTLFPAAHGAAETARQAGYNLGGEQADDGDRRRPLMRRPQHPSCSTSHDGPWRRQIGREIFEISGPHTSAKKVSILLAEPENTNRGLALRPLRLNRENGPPAWCEADAASLRARARGR